MEKENWQIKKLSHPTSPACSEVSYTDRQVVQYTVEQGGRGWVMQLFFRRRGSGVRSQ